MLFLVRIVHVRPAEVGLLFSIGSLGGIAGGVLSGRLARRIGTARIIWFSMLVFGAIPIVLPLTAPGWRLIFFPIAGAGLTFAPWFTTSRRSLTGSSSARQNCSEG